jgi:hypothetical protein
VEGDATRTLEGIQAFDGATQRHAIVGRVGLADVVVAPGPAAPLVEQLDEAGGGTRPRPIAELVAEARFVGVDADEVAEFRDVHDG